MENNNKKEYWGSKFYGSKVNTVLLLVLIILMIFALRIMLKDKATYLPLQLQDNEDQDSEIKTDFKNSTVVFLKRLVEEYPESYIQSCSYKGKDFLSFFNHRLPDSSTLFNMSGTEIEVCSPLNPELRSPDSLCGIKLECKDVYYNNDTINSGSKKFIDVLNLK